MKRLIYIASLSIGMAVFTSCVDDDKLFELDDFETGALPNMQRTTNDPGFINFFELETTPLEFTIDFSIDQEQSPDGGLTSGGDGRINTNTEFRPVASVDLEVRYINAVTGVAETGRLGNYTSWPTTVTMNGIGDLIEALPSLNSVDDINLSDNFIFVCGVNFEDGTTLPAFIEDAGGNPLPNFSVNYSGTANNPGFDYAVRYNVACPSDIPAGSWTTVAPTAAEDPSGCQLFQGTGISTTLIDLGGGNYQFTNFDFGYFGQCCGNISAIFSDVCNTVTFTGATEFGIVWTGTGTFIPDGGANGNGRLVFACHFDATFGGPAATDTVVLDKD